MCIRRYDAFERILSTQPKHITTPRAFLVRSFDAIRLGGNNIKT